MRMRRLGNSGLKVSEVGLGCNNFGMRIDETETQAVVGAADQKKIRTGCLKNGIFQMMDFFGDKIRKTLFRVGNVHHRVQICRSQIKINQQRFFSGFGQKMPHRTCQKALARSSFASSDWPDMCHKLSNE